MHNKLGKSFTEMMNERLLQNAAVTGDDYRGILTQEELHYIGCIIFPDLFLFFANSVNGN